MHYIKKILSVFVVIAILSATLFGNINLISSAEVITTAYIEGTGVRVRTEPSTNSTIIESVSNTSATVLDSVEVNNYIWYKITYHNGTEQITGYIRYDESYIRIVTYDPDADFETKISAFPESYRDALRSLHAAYPNWEFTPDPVSLSFEEAVALQSVNMRKQVSFTSQPVSWRSMGQGAYDWNKDQWVVSNGGWTGASREIIAYYMDPRNFLNSSEIYMFLQQGYNSAVQTEEGIKKIIAGTFMETDYFDPNDTEYGGSYVKVILEAARQSGVSPYIIAAKIRQEIGVDGNSALISGTYSGYEGYYNFFNFGASGSTTAEVISNGLTYAKNNAWNSRSAAIIGGAKRYSNGYISVGQDTYYYQDFNIHNTDKLWHQYAQAVHDARSKGIALADAYKSETSYALNFRIPVFTTIPDSVSPKPIQNETKNNYYFSEITVSGLTPSYSMFNYSYSLKISGDTAVKAVPVSGATLISPKSYNLKSGDNSVKITVKSESGYITDYTISVNCERDCVLYVNDSGSLPEGVTPEKPSVPAVTKGDTNGDGQINLRDLANIRLHLLGLTSLTDNNALGADTNSDGQINLRDLANVRLHLLGLLTITN